MISTLLATIDPMLTLFSCIVIGFFLKKAKILPDNAGKSLSKLIACVFYPALCFSSMARYFTTSTLKSHATNIVISTVGLSFSITIAILLSFIFIKEKCYNRGIYQYALAFANSGYMGDPLVESIFGSEALSYYKLACLPISIAIYTWGISVLVPSGENQKSIFKKLLNPPLVSMFLGMIVGLICGWIVPDVAANTTAYDTVIPDFIIGTLDSLKACMGPSAMLVAGITVAKYDLGRMFKKPKVYAATALRLTVLPAFILASLFGLKELFNLIADASVDNTAILLLFFALGAPLGLNTIIFPEAYNGDPEEGASMAMISHTLCVITIPIMFTILWTLLGGDANTWLTLK